MLQHGVADEVGVRDPIGDAAGAARPGAISPVAARRCWSRRTQAGLTENVAATTDIDIPASTSANTR